MPLDRETLELAERVFAFHQLHHTPQPADVMIVLGTNDKRVATFAADLYQKGISERIFITGGIAHTGDLLDTGWDQPEAEVFAMLMIARGVPPEKLVLETHASNTAENIRFTRGLIKHPQPKSIAYVCKPFMPRRVYATHAVEWPEVPAAVLSWESTFAEYCNATLPQEKILNIMLGDLQRIWIYAKRGYSAPQRIPDDVKHAYDRLVERGFNRHLIRED